MTNQPPFSGLFDDLFRQCMWKANMGRLLRAGHGKPTAMCDDA